MTAIFITIGITALLGLFVRFPGREGAHTRNRAA